MANWTKPQRGVHVFVVLRHDAGIGDTLDAITATKGYATLERAGAEAERLNKVNADTGARYFVRVARFVDTVSHLEPDNEPA